MRHSYGTCRLALLVLVILIAPSHAEQLRTTSIKIAAFGALTGPVKSFGINSRAALLAAARRIDQSGGVKLADGSVGHFDIAYADDHCKPEEGIALLKQAAASDAIVVIGPSCSSVAEPLYGTLHLSWSVRRAAPGEWSPQPHRHKTLTWRKTLTAMLSLKKPC